MVERSNRTVLVVDDEEMNVNVLVETLSGDYDVSVAMDGKSALEYIETSYPDLILLDIMMPDMDGYEVCRLIKADSRTKDIPVIFITALHEIREKTRGFELGAVDYITKPFEILEVKERVKTHMALKAAREQLKRQNLVLDEKVKERTLEVRELNEELKNSLIDSVKILMGLLEGYDPFLVSHSKRVSVLAVEMGEMLGFSKQELFDLEIASLLHNIGTLSIPDALKAVPLEELSKEEQVLVKQHPVFAQSVLSQSKGLEKAGLLIRSHLERIDGSGYPDGLTGDKIQLGSKIIGIINAYDELNFSRERVDEQGTPGEVGFDSSIKTLKIISQEYEDSGLAKTLKKAILQLESRKKDELCINIKFLKPGLVLSRNLYTIQGKLILPKATVLNNLQAQRLMDFHRAGHIDKDVYVSKH